MRRYEVTDFTWHFLTIFYKMDVSTKIKYFKLVQNSRPYANNRTYIYARTYFLSARCVSEFPLATSYDSKLSSVPRHCVHQYINSNWRRDRNSVYTSISHLYHSNMLFLYSHIPPYTPIRLRTLFSGPPVSGIYTVRKIRGQYWKIRGRYLEDSR